MRYLLDTNICVYFLRGNKRIADHIKNVGWENCYVSEITVAELLYGAECGASTKINKATIIDFCDCVVEETKGLRDEGFKRRRV